MARRSGSATLADLPFEDWGLDFFRRGFFDMGICHLHDHRLVMGGKRIRRVLAANALDAMILARGYLVRNRQPTIKSKAG
jgi:hypothetical protein